MPLGPLSLQRLSTCHPEIQALIRRVAQGVDEGDLKYAGITDITVLCGWRNEVDQNKAVADGASETPWPRSAHNVLVDGVPCSDAGDVAVYPVEWKAPDYTHKMEILHAYISGVAHQMGIKLKNISWDRPHIQRVPK